MTQPNHAYAGLRVVFRQYASQAEGDAGNYWQSDDGEFEIFEVGPGFPKPVYDRAFGPGFIAQRTHVSRRRYSEEFVGHFKSVEAAMTAVNEVSTEPVGPGGLCEKCGRRSSKTLEQR